MPNRSYPRPMSWQPGLGLEYRGLVAVLPFRPINANRVHAIHGSLESWNAAAMPVVAAPSVAFNANNGIHALVRGYLLGLCDAQLGDSRGAQREVATLPHAFGATAAPKLTQSFQTAITAEGLALSGHQAEAESMLAANPPEGFYEWFIGSVFRSGGRERFRLAQALAATEAGHDAPYDGFPRSKYRPATISCTSPRRISKGLGSRNDSADRHRRRATTTSSLSYGRIQIQSCGR